MAADGKRRWQGEHGRRDPAKKPARAAAAPSSSTAANITPSRYTPLFEAFRDRLDAHHDRRERVVKASRDVTALSKKVIFALQRVRGRPPAGTLPPAVAGEVRTRLAEIGRLLAGVAPELQGLNRGRHGRVLFGMEELVEALAFLHYLRCQALVGEAEVREQVAALCRGEDLLGQGAGEGEGEGGEGGEGGDDAEEGTKRRETVVPDDNEYLMGVLDLSGEMMRFATTSAALGGGLGSGDDDDDDDSSDSSERRSIVGDMQALGSLFQMLARQRHDKTWTTKLQVLATSVQKVERLGYELRVRGSERPKGWLPAEGEGESP